VFGAFLVFTGIKLFRNSGREEHPERSSMMRLARRLIPSTPHLHGERFWVRENGCWLATPLLMALLMVELTDVVFAVDSIPAIFAITTDPFIVFTSNIFAILGLRSLFFLVAGLVDKFAYLKLGLSAVLVFVGAKMTLIDFVKIPAPVSLAVVVALLGGAVAASWWVARRRAAALPSAR
jgi:tellurite resistance protein TerC